ncbi:MAG: hypothetical protein ACC608_00865 [Anaerofustis sp.]
MSYLLCCTCYDNLPMMDNNALVKESDIVAASSSIIIFANIGNFLASYLLILLTKISQNLQMEYPAMFITLILMVLLTVCSFIVKNRQRRV